MRCSPVSLSVQELVLQAPDDAHALPLPMVRLDHLGQPAPRRETRCRRSPCGSRRADPARCGLVAKLKFVTGAPFAVKRISGIAPI